MHRIDTIGDIHDMYIGNSIYKLVLKIIADEIGTDRFNLLLRVENNTPILIETIAKGLKQLCAQMTDNMNQIDFGNIDRKIQIFRQQIHEILNYLYEELLNKPNYEDLKVELVELYLKLDFALTDRALNDFGVPLISMYVRQEAA